MLNRTLSGRPLRWIKELPDYYFRDEWEMFDLLKDPQESVNLRHKKKYKVFRAEITLLTDFLNIFVVIGIVLGTQGKVV